MPAHLLAVRMAAHHGNQRHVSHGWTGLGPLLPALPSDFFCFLLLAMRLPLGNLVLPSSVSPRVLPCLHCAPLPFWQRTKHRRLTMIDRFALAKAARLRLQCAMLQ